jgi:hypothetical protein
VITRSSPDINWTVDMLSLQSLTSGFAFAFQIRSVTSLRRRSYALA